MKAPAYFPAQVSQFLIILIVLAAIAFAGCTSAGETSATFLPSNVTVTVEKADTPDRISNGLKFRDSMGEMEGMLFYMSSVDYHTFWMMNTRIPLEAVFIDANFTIVDITEMNPCHETNPMDCPAYRPNRPCLYVLELNQNFSKRYGIKQGDHLVLGQGG